jgi:hypothetical protein
MTAARDVTATFAKTFTDGSLQAGVTPIRAAHVKELREAVDTLRLPLGTAFPPSETETITAGQTVVKAGHLNQIRQALVDFGGCAAAVVAAGARIDAAHIEALRSCVRALE